jgi:integrase
MMRALMGLVKDRHGTYNAQMKVPLRLQQAVARVLSNGKSRQVHLKKSLGTKVLKEANIRAKSVLSGFDRVLAQAEAIIARRDAAPLAQQRLNDAEIARIAEHVYASTLAGDERLRFGGREELRRIEAEVMRQLEPGEVLGPFEFPIEDMPRFGRSIEQHNDDAAQLANSLQDMKAALAIGDISVVEDHILIALAEFGIDLAPDSASYPALGAAVLRAYVRALLDLERRNAGEPVETPKVTLETLKTVTRGGTIRDAFKGWEKHRVRPLGTVHEYSRSVELFVQMHGDIPVADIKKRHVREFRSALQQMPLRRAGTLRKATLPELSAWGLAHPEAPKVSPATINKQIGAVQAVSVWASENGLVLEGEAWSDPFSKMRVAEAQSEREPFSPQELTQIFSAPIFTSCSRPAGGKGDAALWLPLLALFTGARQAEIAGLTVADVVVEAGSDAPILFITEQLKVGRRLKTKGSQRAIPVHAQLIILGFLALVEERRQSSGAKAWLFPMVAPDQGSALSAWSKWFGRYLRRTIGVMDSNKVFHSFRHSFKDAARAGRVSQEVHDALTGHANVSAVSGGYGAKKMLQRFGVAVLVDAIGNIRYPGLDLSNVRTRP